MTLCGGVWIREPLPEERSLLPPICYHLGIADEVLSRLCLPVGDENRGSFLLGSTAPDIRFFIGASREETHFVPLDCEEGVSGAKAIFDAHPELVKDAAISPATRAFVAGYLSHLVTDEAWIRGIYRPFFGRSSPMAGDPVANLFDRLLQFELDRRERLGSGSISSIRKELVDSARDVDVGFIDKMNLNRWREFVFIATTRLPHWEDFRAFAEKYLIWMRHIPRHRIEDFFECFDERLVQVLNMVPEDTVQEFREESLADSVKVAREYLG